jgi:hypothetical protein
MGFIQTRQSSLGTKCCTRLQSNQQHKKSWSRKVRDYTNKKFGSGGGIRTPDTRIMIPLL